ncbi:MAG TPA: hypothetical protein VGE23_01310 [Candidatus Paceibacterota bacterium]
MPSFVFMYGPLLAVAGFAAIAGLSQATLYLKYKSVPHEYADDYITSRAPDMDHFGTFCLISLFAIAMGYFGSSTPLVFETSGVETLNSLLLVATVAGYAVLALRFALRNWRHTKAIGLRFEAEKLRRAEKKRADARKTHESFPQTAPSPALPVVPATPVAAALPQADRLPRPARRPPVRRQTRAPLVAKV